jgi:hypothetical protein
MVPEKEQAIALAILVGAGNGQDAGHLRVLQLFEDRRASQSFRIHWTGLRTSPE